MNEATTPGGGLRRLYGWFPTLERDERQDLYARIRGDSTGGPDFYVMMALAATLASLGLLQSSTAVVIGAMLVAPLVGPLLGTGLALVQGNVRLMRLSLQVVLLGMLLGFLISLVFGYLNPGFEPTLEVEARGNPDLLDLFVALASGMVAAYASGRPDVSNTLAGVAIAAALMPPLAAVLLATNLVAIILGAALVFRLLGVKARGDEAMLQPWARRTIAGLMLVAVILAGPLALQGMEKGLVGQNRPYSYPVALPVREAVEEFVARQPSMVVVAMARNGVEPEAGISIILSTLDSVPPDFRDELRRVVWQSRGKSLLEEIEGEATKVRIFIMQEAPIQVD
jgi:uncharacterized hydrophobic protein (TIGR00271 family)